MTETQERPKLRDDRESRRAVYTMMLEGKTTEEIAEHYGTPASVVSRLAQRKNVESALGMLALADAGWTMEEIGKTYGITKQRVSQIIGRNPQVGSRGHIVTVDAAIESWHALMEALDRVDIHVRKVKGADSRALVAFMDGLRDGRYQIVPTASGPFVGGHPDD